MATKQDLDATPRGDTIVLIVTISGVGDIQGDELWFTMKACIDDTDANAALQFREVVPAGAPASAGQHTLIVPATSTAAVDPGKYFYDVQWVNPTPNPTEVHTLVYGVIEILDDVTQDIV